MLSGKIIHDDIINNITSCFTRGQQAMLAYIKDRLIDKTLDVEEPLKAIATISCSYDVKCDDFICSDYQQLIKNNPAVVAARVKECWCTDACIQTLPTGKILVIAGPDDSSVTLRKNHAPTEDYLLVSNHIYACTRSFIHAHAISFENIKSVAFQSSDADIALLAISHGLYLDVDNIYVKSFNTNAKFDIFINTREISINIKEKRSVDPIILIVIHALSGYEAISTAERLLLDSYSLKYTPSSLDEHRAIMASTAFKDNRSSCIALALPPSSNAFYFHCQRVARQSQIWFQAYQSDMSIQSIENNEGYEVIQNEVKIKWLSKNSIPLDHRLSVCGKCFGNCNRCVCGKNNVVCTLLCKCSAEKCKNRTHASSSQNCNLSEILLNDVTRDINFNQSTYDFNTIDSIDKEDGKASQSSFASNCSSYTENTDDDFPHLYQSSEESLSSTADWESTDSNSCSITNIDHSHSNRFNDETKEKSVASEKRNNTINRSLSEFQQMGLSRIKIIQFKTIKSSNIGSESSFNIRSPSTTPLSQPLTSTPLTFRIKKAYSQQVIRKENYDSFENNTPSPLNFNYIVISEHLNYKLKIYAITGDCPALKLVLNFIAHGGYYCCWWRYILGEQKGGKRQYEFELPMIMRDRDAYKEESRLAEDKQINVYGHFGVSVLSSILDIPLPDAIIIDYFHVTLLGHAKAIVSNIFYSLKPIERIQVDNWFKKQNFPHYFNRKIKPISNFGFVKATELKNILFYVALPIFQLYLSVEKLSHLALFVCFTRLLPGQSIVGLETNKIADELFQHFYRDHGEHYEGLQNLVLHLHAHFVTMYNNHGALSNIGCFGQEDLIGSIGFNHHATRYYGELITYYYNIDFALHKKPTKIKTKIEKLDPVNDPHDEYNNLHIELCGCEQIRQCFSIYRRFVINDRIFHSLIYKKR
ncbi:unnamed protein product, partial [Rotaria sp. Silwood2]